jgi:hypothetical protein
VVRARAASPCSACHTPLQLESVPVSCSMEYFSHFFPPLEAELQRLRDAVQEATQLRLDAERVRDMAMAHSKEARTEKSQLQVQAASVRTCRTLRPHCLHHACCTMHYSAPVSSASRYSGPPYTHRTLMEHTAAVSCRASCRRQRRRTSSRGPA